MTELNEPKETPKTEQLFQLFWCSCEGWAKSMPSLTGAQMLAHLHGTPYKGKVFSYCPWCGIKLDQKFTPEF